MGQYKRMVSYLYKYINGAKSQNTGFVRIELMDVQCRFYCSDEDGSSLKCFQKYIFIFKKSMVQSA